jgi:hypothetical protein
MYPQPQLNFLASRKCTLRTRIRVHRAACAETIESVTLPFRWVDQLLGMWRDLAPVVLAAAVPLGILGHRGITPRLKTLRHLVHWGPIVLSLVRNLTGKR